MNAVITGIGWVTSTGPGWAKGGQDFCMIPGAIPPIARKQLFSEPNQRFGRQSEYSKLGLSAIAFALRDAGLENWVEKRPIGVVAASVHGSLVTDLDYFQTVLPAGGGLPSPNLFAYTLANCFMGEAAIQFGLTGSTMVINESVSNGLTPLRMALEIIDWNEHDTMLAGICDVLVPEPFRDICSTIPGALFMVLTGKDSCIHSGYGNLSLSGNGALLYNGEKTASIIELAKRCLEDRKAGRSEG